MALISYGLFIRLLIISLLFWSSMSKPGQYSLIEPDSDFKIPDGWIEEVPVPNYNGAPHQIKQTSERTKGMDKPRPQTILDTDEDQMLKEADSQEISDPNADTASDTASDTAPKATPAAAMLSKGGQVNQSIQALSVTTYKPIDASKLVELCDKPVVINAANCFPNSTVRLYRDKTYWELMGLPDRVGFTNPKETLWAPLAPVGPKTSIVTIFEGSPELKGRTLKIEKQFMWVWDENGKQERGGKGGESWEDIPVGGFDSMFHNGNATRPMIIALKDDLVYYISTKESDLQFIDTEGKKGGKFNENYPKNIRAAFTWTINSVPNVYLIRNDKYCLREVGPTKSGKDCDEWRDTFELFGCKEEVTTTTTTTTTTSKPQMGTTVETMDETNPEPDPIESMLPQPTEMTQAPPQPVVVATVNGNGYQISSTRYSYSLPICFSLFFPIFFN